jgi:hypothetical protein
MRINAGEQGMLSLDAGCIIGQAQNLAGSC